MVRMEGAFPWRPGVKAWKKCAGMLGVLSCWILSCSIVSSCRKKGELFHSRVRNLQKQEATVPRKNAEVK